MSVAESTFSTVLSWSTYAMVCSALRNSEFLLINNLRKILSTSSFEKRESDQNKRYSEQMWFGIEMRCSPESWFGWPNPLQWMASTGSSRPWELFPNPKPLLGQNDTNYSHGGKNVSFAILHYHMYIGMNIKQDFSERIQNTKCECWYEEKLY